MEDIIIRKIEEKDIPSVVDIQIDGWQTAYRGIIDDATLNKMNREEKIRKRKQDYKQCGFIVAEVNGEIVGFCRYVDCNKFSANIPDIDCELLAIYVKSDLKYMGIGTRLFQYVINEFKSKNKTKMIVWCLKENMPTRRFYEKMGGKVYTIDKSFETDGKNYKEVGFIYNIQ